MSNFSLLHLDGTKFKPSDKEINYIVTNKEIEKFLESDENSSIAVIVGQKGSGKSIFISLKSYLDKEGKKASNIIFIPNDEAIEKIQLDDQLSASALAKNVRYTDWERIFKISIYYFILAKLKNVILLHTTIKESQYQKIPFHDLFNPLDLDPTNLSFGTILNKAIRRRTDILYKNQSDFIGLAKQIIVEVLKYKHVSIYFDNLDQTLFSALKRENYSTDLYEDLDYLLSTSFGSIDSDNMIKTWFNGHVGYFLAIHSINEFNKELNIYTTFRLEAYEYLCHLPLKNKPQFRSIAVQIKYSDKNYENIFNQLLQAAEIQKKEIEKVGLNNLIHTGVSNTIYKKESLWSFIKRHTFGNPREITSQIQVLQKEMVNFSNTPPYDLNIRRFKLAIASDATKEIIRDLKAETLPHFPTNELQKFCIKNKQNWIRKEDLKENRNLVTILYRLGLIGVIQRRGNDYTQIFLDKNVYFTNKEESLPSSPYYLLHPTLDHILQKAYPEGTYYYPHCIIGNGNPFYLLRDISYYIPKNIDKGSKAYHQFSAFYHKTEYKYSGIIKGIIEEWSPRIWEYIFLQERKKFIDYLFSKVNDQNKTFHSVRKKNNKKNLLDLQRNYKLRIIIAFAVLAKLIINHKEIINIVKFRAPNDINEITYFNKIRKGIQKGSSMETYLQYLSDFENGLIKECLDKPVFSEELKKRISTQNLKMKDINKKIEKMKHNLSRYN